MKIAIDCQSTQGQKTGIGSYTAALLPALQSEAPDIEFLRYTTGPSKDLNTLGRIGWESLRIPLRARRDKADLIYSPGFAPAVFSTVPQVVTVHDLIGMVFPGNQGAVSSFYWSRWLPFCIKRAARLVASSVSTQTDIERLLGIPKERVGVVPLFADPVYRVLDDNRGAGALAKSLGLQKPFFICVGSLEPRKNLRRLAEAYARLRRSGSADFQIAIVGKSADAESPLKRFVADEGLTREVVFLGYRSTEEIVALYQAALGFVSVSLYEGFGLPALEAMSCGLSGVVSDRTSLPEIVGTAAVLVDPEKVDAIASALVGYATDAKRRQDLSALAHQRSKLFSAAVTARRLIEIFKQAISG